MFILVYPIKVQPRLELEWIFITIPSSGNKRAYSIVEYLLGHKTHNKGQDMWRWGKLNYFKNDKKNSLHK